MASVYPFFLVYCCISCGLFCFFRTLGGVVWVHSVRNPVVYARPKLSLDHSCEIGVVWSVLF